MAQPYDLTGIANLQTTIVQMLADQNFGSVNFCGGDETWVPNPTGWFKAILTTGRSPTATTIYMQRTALKNVRTILDLIAGGTGTAAALAVQQSTPPSFLLETGRAPTGPNVAFGPLVNAASSVANTSYDLSGIAALQTAANSMLADQQSRTTVFTGWGETWKVVPQGQFQAIYVPGGNPQTTNMGAVIDRFKSMQLQFDQLGTDRGIQVPGLFYLDVSVLDGGDVLG